MKRNQFEVERHVYDLDIIDFFYLKENANNNKNEFLINRILICLLISLAIKFIKNF